MAAPGKPEMTLERKTILVVDDEVFLREILVDLFKMDRARVLEADNGVDALAIVMNDSVDVVITDARMPGGDVVTLIRALAALPYPKPLVFFCSGFSDLSDDEAKSLGVRDVFVKPFDVFKVRDSILSHLTNHPAKPAGKV